MTMSYEIHTCPIWGQRHSAKGSYSSERGTFDIEDSDRTFVGYRIDKSLVDSEIASMSDKEKSLLTTWLLNQWELGVDQPIITGSALATIRNNRPLPVRVRADRLLRLIVTGTNAERIGVQIAVPRNEYMYYAWSESTNWPEITYLLNYLIARGWLERVMGSGGYIVTVDGHSRIEEIEQNKRIADSLQGFVAMWFHDVMDQVYEAGIRPAIESAGYTSQRIDKKPDVNKVDDEIMSEIRRSRFLVADFTHGEDGARGGVYFEAGFAHGMGIPVIYTCRADMVDKLHFDTRQYAHILWERPEELRDALRNRIVARLGLGPSQQ